MWTCLDSTGAAVEVDTGTFPTQGEAEAWLGESWEELAEQGVASVSLEQNGVVAYGPMKLDPA